MEDSAYDARFLVATQDYNQNQAVVSLGTKKTTADDDRRIQLNANEFILAPHLLYHACEPNAYIDWRDMILKAKHPILKGDRVTYHYGTLEYDYGVGAFACDCGSIQCVGYFSGFCSMTESEQAGVIECASPYIRTMYFKNKGSGKVLL